jgi:transcriptional regulator with XRE-family HTH domain
MKTEEKEKLYDNVSRDVLGKIIRGIRGKETREEFVKRLESKTSASKLESYENGRAFPPLSFLIQLALICNVSLDYLLLKREVSPLLFKEDLDTDQRHVLGLIEEYPKLIDLLKNYEKVMKNEETKNLVDQIFGEVDEEYVMKLAVLAK